MGKEKAKFDERDMQIQRKSVIYGYGATIVVFVPTGAFIPLFLDAKLQVPITVVPFVILLIVVFQMLAQSVTSIILYRRDLHA